MPQKTRVRPGFRRQFTGMAVRCCGKVSAWARATALVMGSEWELRWQR
jgi:hypothetical protein